eukprot:6121705-Pleurochrysis_carterae.AAC.1
MRTPAVAAFHKALVPCASLHFASFIASVPRRVGSLAACVRRRGRWCRRGTPELLGDEGASLWLVQLNVAPNLACLEVAKYFTDRRKR